MGEESVEIQVFDGIEEVSEKIKQSTFEAYMTLEGVFQGIERIMGDQIPQVLKEITDRTHRKCLFARLSLRKRDGKWDEVILLVCNKIVMVAHGNIDDEELSGKDCLVKLAFNINRNVYTIGMIELTELPVSFIERRLGVSLELIGMPKEVEEEKPKKPKLAVKPKREVEELIEGGEKPSMTIPVETSLEQTKILTVEEARKFLPPTLVPALNIPGVKRVVEEEKKVEAKAKPLKIREIIDLDKAIIELSDKLLDLAGAERINILQAIVTGGLDELIVEITITKLGLTRKRAKMLSIANSIADTFHEIMSRDNKGFKKVTVIVRHGYDAVKVTREL